MKTLKKSLSLLMAVVMIFGLFAVASASNFDEFKDDDEVRSDYKEMVDVLIGLGLIKGKDSMLAPKEELPRIEAITMVVGAKLGAEGMDSLRKAPTAFTDVPDWASGIVNYAHAEGITYGVGGGLLGSYDSVTGWQFIRMLIGALGYASQGEITSDNWEMQTAALNATEGLKLYDGIDKGFDLMKPITREQAMRILFNSIFAQKTTYVSALKIYVKGPSMANEQNIYWDYTGDGFHDSADAFGRPGSYQWYKAGEAISDVYSASPIKVYTKETSVKTVRADAANNDIAAEDTWINGNTLDDDFVIKANENDSIVLNGEVGELYKCAEGDDYILVVYTHFLGSVSKVTAKSGDTDRYVTLVGGDTFTTDDFAKEDTVVFTAVTADFDDFAIDEIQDMWIADETDGKVSAINNKDAYLRLDGEKLVYADIYAGNGVKAEFNIPSVGDEIAVKDEGIFYLCPNGFLLGAKEGAKADPEYLLLQDLHEYLGEYEGNVVFTDGKAAKKISIISLKDFGNENFDNYEDAKGWIFSYTVNEDGEYKLTQVDATRTAAASDEEPEAGAIAINKNIRQFVLSGASESVDAEVTTAGVTLKTIFVDVKSGEVFTGYEQVPTYKKASGVYHYNEEGTAIVVFITDGSTTQAESKFVYFNDWDGEQTDAGYFTMHNAFINGKALGDNGLSINEGALLVDVEGNSTPINTREELEALNTNLFEIVNVDSKGRVTEIKPVDVDPLADVDELATKIIFLQPENEAKHGIAYDSNTVFVIIGTDKKVAVDGTKDDIVTTKTVKEGETVSKAWTNGQEGTEDAPAAAATVVYVWLQDAPE
ncbi:hypothetical protein LJC01_03205 [Clostridiaceae bacterium OttesenSCG-928-D20]|nr:hypothetical protein [Clostridiaceae bacterium OttesenSCG-928-D20]